MDLIPHLFRLTTTNPDAIADSVVRIGRPNNLATTRHLWLMLQCAHQDRCRTLFTGHWGDKLFYREFIWPLETMRERSWSVTCCELG